MSHLHHLFHLLLQTLGSKNELYHMVPHLWQSHCLKQRSHISFRKLKTSDEILLDQNGYEICSMTDETDIHDCSVVYWWRAVNFYTDVLHWCVGILMYCTGVTNTKFSLQMTIYNHAVWFLSILTLVCFMIQQCYLIMETF